MLPARPRPGSRSRPLPTLDGHSYYLDTAHARPRHPPLLGCESAQACVVGGGIAGLSAALELARCGVQVTLLEARRVGAGASGRNGGQALADFACGIEALERALGPHAALRAWEASQHALRMLRRRIVEHAIDCDWLDGALSVACSPRDAARAETAMRRRQRRYGATQLRWLDAGELRRRIDSECYVGGVLDPLGGHLHPLNYTLGLARAAHELGVRVCEHSPVTQLREQAGGYRLSCPRGELHTQRLVLAAGAVPGPPPRRLRARVLPVAASMLATEALAAPVLRGGEAICDSGFAPAYFRLSADGRLLFGAGAHYTGGLGLGDTAHRRERLRRAMLRVFPQLHDARITHSWGGWIDVSANRAPDFGHFGRGAVYLQGFSGHGLALAGLAGELAARELLGGPGSCLDFQLFARIRHLELLVQPWLRIPLTLLGALWGRFLHTL